MCWPRAGPAEGPLPTYCPARRLWKRNSNAPICARFLVTLAAAIRVISATRSRASRSRLGEPCGGLLPPCRFRSGCPFLVVPWPCWSPLVENNKRCAGRGRSKFAARMLHSSRSKVRPCNVPGEVANRSHLLCTLLCSRRMLNIYSAIMDCGRSWQQAAGYSQIRASHSGKIKPYRAVKGGRERSNDQASLRWPVAIRAGTVCFGETAPARGGVSMVSRGRSTSQRGRVSII